MSAPSEGRNQSRPLSVRFSEAEKTRLAYMAAGKPLGQFIRERALDGTAEPRRVSKPVVKDADALGRLLGQLGQSRLANNLNQLAKAANLGSLPVTSEVEADLRQACSEVFEMRSLLLAALGVQIMGQVATATDTFSEAAGDR
ncbi:plasmid mobilization relaxosome protein MobC [Bradyrhizobium sp. 2]|uniref:plasmid mobilization protein n=1 Tax=Bradyrhizobium sp. 2 TaxID=190045 RepID=UPI001FFB4CA7|nr:plasmid mobilization relaxosome protein MobC [Bradyrhizobium sp. 2]MCK1463067.1 plasmid mobilization relaxosome protein MobC [Bradyrhizobium sp. 2]